MEVRHAHLLGIPELFGRILDLLRELCDDVTRSVAVELSGREVQCFDNAMTPQLPYILPTLVVVLPPHRSKPIAMRDQPDH